MHQAFITSTVIQVVIAYLMTISLKRLSKICHSGKKTAQLLNMMGNVNCFLVQFCDDIQDAIVLLLIPRMLAI